MENVSDDDVSVKAETQQVPPIGSQLKTARDSAAVKRLLDEVRNEEADFSAGYNRMHNRHNR